MILKKKRKPEKPVVRVRKVGTKWVARCTCGNQFTDDASEKALSSCVSHAYSKHKWSSHSVKFN